MHRPGSEPRRRAVLSSKTAARVPVALAACCIVYGVLDPDPGRHPVACVSVVVSGFGEATHLQLVKLGIHS